MIEQLQFHDIRDVAEAATSLAGCHKTRYPEGGGPSFTGFLLPKGFAAGLRLERSGADLWNAFVRAHTQAQLAGAPRDSHGLLYARDRECAGAGVSFDDATLKLDESYWTCAVEESEYVSA